MLHLHFEYLERTHDGYLLTDEHLLMFEAIKSKDVERADELAHAHTRRFRDNFIDFMRENYTTDIALGLTQAAEYGLHAIQSTSFTIPLRVAQSRLFTAQTNPHC